MLFPSQVTNLTDFGKFYRKCLTYCSFRSKNHFINPSADIFYLSAFCLLEHLFKFLIIFIIRISSWLASRSGHKIRRQLSDGRTCALNRHSCRYYTFTFFQISWHVWPLNLSFGSRLCRIYSCWLHHSPTCRPPGGPLTWLRRERRCSPCLLLQDRWSGLGMEALGSLWSHIHRLPEWLKLYEGPKGRDREILGIRRL